MAQGMLNGGHEHSRQSAEPRTQAPGGLRWVKTACQAEFRTVFSERLPEGTRKFQGSSQTLSPPESGCSPASSRPSSPHQTQSQAEAAAASQATQPYQAPSKSTNGSRFEFFKQESKGDLVHLHLRRENSSPPHSTPMFPDKMVHFNEN